MRDVTVILLVLAVMALPTILFACAPPESPADRDRTPTRAATPRPASVPRATPDASEAAAAFRREFNDISDDIEAFRELTEGFANDDFDLEHIERAEELIARSRALIAGVEGGRYGPLVGIDTLRSFNPRPRSIRERHGRAAGDPGAQG